MRSGESDEVVVAFGPFQLNIANRRLYCGAEEVRVGGRGMDILLALAERRGEVVSKERLFAAGWPGVFVQDSNLKVTIAYLRRALREHAPAANYINNVVGRGYWLDSAAPCEPVSDAAECPAPAAPLPEPRQVIGRDEEIAAIHHALAQDRLVSIVGAGGMGKTTVAQAAARLVGEQGCPVTFVDFSRTTNEDYVASSLASALGIGAGGDSLQAVVSILAGQRMLLVLDTCEHVLSAVVHICEVILAKTRNVRILATSRQLLRARGERVFWLSPLAFPAADQPVAAQELLRFAAPRLLVARAAEKGYSIAEADARHIAEICRRLDGSPLAIELVSSRLAGRSIPAVMAELDARFLTLRRETADGPQRQQTLMVTLQWSYALLSDAEREVLRALSVFAGAFDIDAAVRVAAGGRSTPVDILDAIAGLRSKSMLGVQQAADGLRYRLLDSTRAFAGELLDSAGETAGVCDRHAALQLEVLDRAEAARRTMPQHRWRAAHGGLIDELRKALDWTLFRSANPLRGLELVAAGLPLWLEFSLGVETLVNCERALAEFERIGSNDAALKLRLLVGLARVSTYVSADTGKSVSLFHNALRVAQDMGDARAQCHVLGALATYELMPGRGGAVFETLELMRDAALRSGDPAALWEEAQLRSQWEIRICDFDAALARVEALFDAMREDAEGGSPRFQIHQKMNVEVQLAALNWLKGRPGEAVRVAALAAHDAEAAGHGLTLIHCLAQGIVWTLIQCRQFDAVRPYIAKLRHAIYRHGMAAWIPVANCYDAVIAAMAGERPDPEMLRAAYAEVRGGMMQLRHDARYAMFAEAMLANGQAADAAHVIRDVFELSAEPWGKCEFLRLRAATERALGRDGDARVTLMASLDAARAIRCPAWELRSALDLATLLGERSAHGEARHILAPVHARFTDGFETGDLANARLLLAQLARRQA